MPVASGALTLPAATDTLVGKATTDIFSNKTISSAGLPIAGATSGNTTLAASVVASGTLTLPAASDTLVGRATTDTLTNKTLTTPTLAGVVPNYDSFTTVGAGLVPLVATADLVAQTAAIGTTTLFTAGPAGGGQYFLTWNAKVTTAAGTSSTLGPLTITYIDPDGVTQTLTAGAFGLGGAVATSNTGNNTTAVLLGTPYLLNVKSSTSVTYSMGYASNPASAMAYNLHIKLAAML